MKYKNAQSPEEYLCYVLSNWKAYKKTNGGICQAIRDLLEKVGRLEQELQKENRK